MKFEELAQNQIPIRDSVGNFSPPKNKLPHVIDENSPLVNFSHNSRVLCVNLRDTDSTLIELLLSHFPHTNILENSLLSICPICICILKEPFTFINCGHVICFDCILKLKCILIDTKIHKKCPICRNSSQVIKLFL